jgi:hypothetical protein
MGGSGKEGLKRAGFWYERGLHYFSPSVPSYTRLKVERYFFLLSHEI